MAKLTDIFQSVRGVVAPVLVCLGLSACTNTVPNMDSPEGFQNALETDSGDIQTLSAGPENYFNYFQTSLPGLNSGDPNISVMVIDPSHMGSDRDIDALIDQIYSESDDQNLERVLWKIVSDTSYGRVLSAFSTTPNEDVSFSAMADCYVVANINSDTMDISTREGLETISYTDVYAQTFGVSLVDPQMMNDLIFYHELAHCYGADEGEADFVAAISLLQKYGKNDATIDLLEGFYQSRGNRNLAAQYIYTQSMLELAVDQWEDIKHMNISELAAYAINSTDCKINSQGRWTDCEVN